MVEINPKNVYTTEETRDFLKISESTIKRLLKKGIINAYKIGGQHRIWGSEILRLMSPKTASKVYRIYDKARTKTRRTIEKW